MILKLLIVLILFFSVLAMVFFLGYGENLIAGVRDWTPKERERYDLHKYGCFMGGISGLIAFGLILVAMSISFETPLLLSVGALLSVLSAFVACFVPQGWFRRR